MIKCFICVCVVMEEEQRSVKSSEGFLWSCYIFLLQIIGNQFVSKYFMLNIFFTILFLRQYISWNRYIGPVLESDMQTRFTPPPLPQKWPNLLFFCPERCIIFINVCKNNFSDLKGSFNFTKFSVSGRLLRT